MISQRLVQLVLQLQPENHVLSRNPTTDLCLFLLLQDRVWASVAKRLNCIIAMVDQLQEEDNGKAEPVAEQQLADVITSHNPGNDWFLSPGSIRFDISASR